MKATDASHPPRAGERARIFADLVVAADLSKWLGERALRDGGVDPYGFLFLAHLATLGAVAPTRLAAHLGMRRTTVRDALAVLEERGDVERIASPSDRRSQLVQLTAQGRAAYERGSALLEEAAGEVEAALGRPLDDVLRPLGQLTGVLRERVRPE